MRNPLGLSMAVAACLLVAASGCDYRRAGVRLLDGDTGEPIAGGLVYTPHGEWGARPDSATTDAEGRATLWVAGKVGGGFGAKPDGYLRNDNYHLDGGGAAEVTVLAYRPPEPLAGLTVPAGFRGVLRVRPWQYGDPQPAPPPVGPPWMDGRREFHTSADPDGVTALAPPPELTDQPYATRVQIARFDDGTPLRYENPTARLGRSGESVYGLTRLRDRVPPSADGVALFHLGLRTAFAPTTDPSLRFDSRSQDLYFVGTDDAAAAEQRRLLAGASELPEGRAASQGYAFRPEPLSLDAVPVGEQLGPTL